MNQEKTDDNVDSKMSQEGSHLIMHRTNGLYRTPNPNPSPLVHPI